MAAGIAAQTIEASADTQYTVGGVRMARPFKVRRLGHFGINVADPEVSRRFYESLLGFRISDKLDFSPRFTPEELPQVGPVIGYFARHGTEHHSFVMFPRRALAANYKFPNEFPEVTTNQITWQVGSLREVVEGFNYFKAKGLRIHRSGRDLPGSNWNAYPFDPDGHVNEIFYGIEQVGWDGVSKPLAMHNVRYTAPPALPHRSEFAEVKEGLAKGVKPADGWRQNEPEAEHFDVNGVLLARPFKIVRVGPMRIFVKSIEIALPFYRDVLGLTVTEEVTWNGHRCVFLRANTEHHSIALYPVALRAELGLHSGTTVLSFGMQMGDYAQLQGAVAFLKNAGVTIKYLPPELFPGVGHCAFAIDPDGHAVQLYHAMEQVGWYGKPRPAAQRVKIDNAQWPETIDEQDSFAGEVFLGPLN